MQTSRLSTTYAGASTNQPARPPQTPNAQQLRQPNNNIQGSRPPTMPLNKPPVSTTHQGGNTGGVQPQEYNGPVAFLSARAVNKVPATNSPDPNNSQLPIPQGQHLFNPKAESPSIRKTPGIDHSSSKPLARNGQHVPPPASQQSAAPSPAGNTSTFTPVRPTAPNPAQRGSIANPSLDQARRIGAPVRPGSPLSNRGSYKPPSMKRNLPTEGGARTPLADLPVGENGTGTSTGAGPSGVDAKRQKMT